MSRITKIIATVTLGLAATGLLGGYLHAAQAPSVQAPRACMTPASSGETVALPAGDAARFSGRTFVCTDGTWVRVTGYGN